MRYFVRFSYRGTNYHGSQTQPNGITVQQTMEEAFSLLLREPVSLTFAGRTDAGVHAEMMYAHFDGDTWSADERRNLVFRLNGILPDDIALHEIRGVREDAHARFDATERTYEYRIIDHKDVFTRDVCTRVRPGLDLQRMNEAARHLIGRQDFASFCRSHTDVKTTLCDLRQAKWHATSEGTAVFTITADRFLRNMVRAVVGTLLEIGYGKRQPDEMRAIIDHKDRCVAGQSAPAEGLFLTDIRYPDDIWN